MSIGNDRIRCSVSNCHYWSQGNNCDASAIMVTSDAVPRETWHGIDSSAIGGLDTPVQQCEQTCCKTFISEQEKDEHQVDDVTKAGNTGQQFTQQQQPRLS